MEEQNPSQITEFNRTKIYEKLIYFPEPEGYDKSINWVVQNQIADTNGRQYHDKKGKLNEYPVYELPVKKVTGDKIMLDIGSGWGRWLISGAKKGYIPVGVDIRLEFCESQQAVLKDFNLKGYSVVGDLENLPFTDDTFDLVWSFSVIQHTHRRRLMNCLEGIDRILKESGFTKLEFPNKNGWRNAMRPSIINDPEQQDYNSWSVRYYSPKEYEEIIQSKLKNFSFSNHSFMGIGVLKEDVKYVSLPNKILCLVSLGMSGMTKIIPPFKYLSDSIYIEAQKRSSQKSNPYESTFLANHTKKEFDNLHIVSLLKCPRHGTPVVLSQDRQKLISEEAGIYYPVVSNIPIMIASEALSL